MSDLKDALKKLCNDTNIVKETYYGSSHRASLSLNGEKAEWDIFHIGIPFSPKKESELMRRFGLDREDLPGFYGSFEKAVVRHITLMKALRDSGMPEILKSVVEYKSVQYYPRINTEGKQIGQDFYLISQPMEDFVGSDIITHQGAHLQDINNLAIRLLQTAKSFSENGFSLGAIDLDSCFYASEGPEKKYLKIAYSFYGTGPGISPDIYPEDVRAFIPESVACRKEEQGLDSDVRTICAYIWTMLDGKHYTEPNFNAWVTQKYYSASPQSVPMDMFPRYAPSELSSLLVEGMTQGADAVRSLQTGLRQLNKRIVSGEVPNTYIRFEEPSFLQRPLPDIRPESTEDEKQEDVEKSSETNNSEATSLKKKPKVAGLIIAMASSLILCAGIMFLYGDVILNLLHPVHYSMSSNDNVYVEDGKVVNDRLKVYSEYALDDLGNIVKASDPDSILYPEDYVSEYVYCENIKLTIIEKHFSGIWNETDSGPELRENVIDLRGIQDLHYSYAADDPNEIPESVIENYGIREDSLILMNNDPEDPESFAVVMLVDITGTIIEWDSEAAASDENTSGEEKDDPGYPVQEVQAISDSLLYKTQGEWRYKVQVSLDPEDVANRRIRLSTEDPAHMIFVVEDEAGKETKTKSIQMSITDGEEVSFFVTVNTEGKYLIRAESEDGGVNKRIQMTFDPPSGYTVESLPPRPTPVPTETPSPSPTPAVESPPTPMPVDTPWQEAYSTGAYPDIYDSGGYGPVTSVNPVETVPEPAPAPASTPEPQIPLSCSISLVELAVGETFRLGDYLEGIEGGYVTAVPSPDGIVSISQADGFLLTALSQGNCNVIISKGTESISVSITVL